MKGGVRAPQAVGQKERPFVLLREEINDRVTVDHVGKVGVGSLPWRPAPEPARDLVFLGRKGAEAAAVRLVVPHGPELLVRDRGVGELALSVRRVSAPLEQFRQGLRAVERGLGPRVGAVAIGAGRVRIQAAENGGARRHAGRGGAVGLLERQGGPLEPVEMRGLDAAERVVEPIVVHVVDDEEQDVRALRRSSGAREAAGEACREELAAVQHGFSGLFSTLASALDCRGCLVCSNRG